MAGQVTIERRDSGELVARKRPVDSTDVAGLRREAAVLALVQGDGIVELLGVLDDASEGGPVVELAHVGGSLETGGTVDATTAVRLVAQTAAALSRVHALGISHGRIEASHVLRDATGAAVVCGWGHGGARPDLSVPSGQPFDPTADVAMVGSLLTSLLSGAGQATGRRARGRARSDQRLRTKAGALATAAGHPNLELRPSMAELAQRLGDMVPAPKPADGSPMTAGAQVADEAGAVGRTSAPEVDTPRPWAGLTGWLASFRSSSAGLDGRRSLRSPHVLAVAGVAALAAVVTAIGMAPFGARPPGTGTAQAAPAGGTGSGAVQPAEADGEVAAGAAGPTTSATTATARAATTAAMAGAACPATAEELASTGLPVGCGGAVVVSGREIRFGSMRYLLGDDGDHVVLADMRCDGVARPALLRPATGDLFVFEGWASAGADTSGRLIGRFPGAASLEATLDGPCGQVAVVAVDGSRSVLTAEELR